MPFHNNNLAAHRQGLRSFRLRCLRLSPSSDDPHPRQEPIIIEPEISRTCLTSLRLQKHCSRRVLAISLWLIQQPTNQGTTINVSVGYQTCKATASSISYYRIDSFAVNLQGKSFSVYAFNGCFIMLGWVKTIVEWYQSFILSWLSSKVRK